MYPVKRRIFFLCGVLSVTTGIVGMFLPLLPTTPFLLLAAVCFAKSSEKAYQWLLTNRWCGEYISNYREHKGISLRHKIFTLSLLWISIGYSALFVAERVWVRLVLAAVAAAVTVHVARMATCKRKQQESISAMGRSPRIF